MNRRLVSASRLSALEALEAERSVALRDADRAFLLRHNGGVADAGPRDCLVSIRQEREGLLHPTVDDTVAEFFGWGEPGARVYLFCEAIHMMNSAFDSPEAAVLSGFPVNAVRIVARVHGDDAYVLLDTRPHLVEVNVRGRWVEAP